MLGGCVAGGFEAGGLDPAREAVAVTAVDLVLEQEKVRARLADRTGGLDEPVKPEGLGHAAREGNCPRSGESSALDQACRDRTR